MTLARQETVDGLNAELDAFEDLLRSLDASEWATPSRCDGWTVGDVAGHVVGQMSDVVNGRFDGLGTPEGTQRQVDERRGREAKELADELRELRPIADAILGAIDDAAWAGDAPPGVTGTLGDGVEALWYDAWLHGDDIRSAIGRPTDAGGSVRAALSHVTTILTGQGWGPATVRADGHDVFTVSGGGGREVTGDAVVFVLAATGRADPAALGLDETVNIYR
jgi:uncharacterized protein (TIGR03083 family)